MEAILTERDSDGTERKYRVTKPEHVAFVNDMEENGYGDVLREYSGRCNYHGPAVVVEDYLLQDVIRATEVRLRTDSMGLKTVVYPSVGQAEPLELID